MRRSETRKWSALFCQDPPLTTEKVEGYRRGTLAFKMVKALLDGEDLKEKHVYIRSVIIERESLKSMK